MAHDIIDNRREKLVEHIREILPAADRARFAVGYFFLSGLEALDGTLDNLQELRLLIGNTTNRATIEQIAEGYGQLKLTQEALERQRFAPAAEQQRRAGDTATALCDSLQFMEQTDEAETLVQTLVRLIAQGRLKVRVYTKGRLHAKAYIFDYAQPQPGNRGIAIVGSSNFTLSGIRDNTELNVLVHDNASPLHPQDGNHGRLTQWFNELWDEAQEFEPHLMEELNQSWAAHPATPWDVYMKALLTLVGDRLDGDDTTVLLSGDRITRSLADFQKVAVERAIAYIKKHGGCFVSDVVGLGKSFIGAAIVKHFERAERARPLIICPKALVEMWERYDELYELNAKIVSMSALLEGERGVNLLEDYAGRDFVLIDESHNFRHASSQRYAELEAFLAGGERRVCLLTATPLNARALDVYHQMKLFHRDEVSALPIDPPHLRQFFGAVERGEKELRELLEHVLIRRTRRDIVRWFGYAEDTHLPLRAMTDAEAARYLSGDRRAYVLVGGKHQFFPRRRLETLRYSIEDTYSGLYQTLRATLGQPRGEKAKSKPGRELTYARYGLWNYVAPAKQKSESYRDLKRAGVNLRGLIRAMLFKRFESSVCAFRKTLERMIASQQMFLRSLEAGFVPAGQDAEKLLGHAAWMDEDELLTQLEDASIRYKIADFRAAELKAHVEADLELLRRMLALVEPITAEHDAKLQTFLHALAQPPLAGRKVLIFTQYADTARYLFEQLNPDGTTADIEAIYNQHKNKSRVVARFAPKANAALWDKCRNDGELRLLVATDVLAEGLNMQDCDIVVNYDLHWNPVRLIQRFGRIDRIGSEHAQIWGYNFLPETGLEKNLGIHAVLQRRIAEIHETLGEDAAILDATEQLNEAALYAIYEQDTAQGSLFEDGDSFDLNEAEALLRNLRRDDPAEWTRLLQLRDGIRTARTVPGTSRRWAVLCRAGDYKALYLVDADGTIIARDTTKALPLLHAERADVAREPLPPGHNAAVMRVLRLFSEEVRHRQAQRDHSRQLGDAQKYVQRELRLLFGQTEDEDLKPRLNLLERAFCTTSLPVAIRRDVNEVKRHGLNGARLVEALTEIYHAHGMASRPKPGRERGPGEEKDEIPRIVCSEALV